MWVMSPTRGFYSAVQHRDKPDRVLVRARAEEDIRNLADLLPDAEPWKLVRSDYEWRLETSTEEWAVAVATMATEIDYPNVKNRVKDPLRAGTYMRVWSALLDLERPGRWKEKWATPKKGKKGKKGKGKSRTTPSTIFEPEEVDSYIADIAERYGLTRGPNEGVRAFEDRVLDFEEQHYPLDRDGGMLA